MTSFTRRQRLASAHGLLYVVLTIISIVALFPLLWTLMTSITPRDLVYQWPPNLIPDQPTLEAYTAVVQRTQLPRNFLNSVIVATSTVALSLLVGSMAAFRFARGRFPGKDLILFLFVATIMIPGLSNIIPLYIIMRRLSLLNTYTALVLVYTAGNMPLVVWLLKGFIDGLPIELDESAVIDGANSFQVFRHIILPLIAPGLSAAAVLTFVNAWNEFLVALTFIQSSSKRTLQPAIQQFVGYYEQTEWTYIAAATLIACVPVVIVFLFLQRALIAGLTAGSVKG